MTAQPNSLPRRGTSRRPLRKDRPIIGVEADCSTPLPRRPLHTSRSGARIEVRSAMTRKLRNPLAKLLVLALLVLAALSVRSYLAFAESPVVVPPPTVDVPPGSSASAVAVLAGGCFWGVQGVYQHVNGVTNAVSGYAGG